jgi:hypothetical protein
VRTKRRPAFSITRRDALFTAIVEAYTRSAPSSPKALSINALDPSVA